MAQSEIAAEVGLSQMHGPIQTIMGAF